MITNILDILTQVYPLVAALSSMAIAQTIKLSIWLMKNKEVRVKSLSASGGMPSSHSALVSGLTTAIGLQEGWNSGIFCVSLTLSLIILYDAAGVRRAVGNQAELLNSMMEDMIHKKEFSPKKINR